MSYTLHKASESILLTRSPCFSEVKVALHDLKLAARLLTLEEAVVSNRLTLADIEIEKSAPRH